MQLDSRLQVEQLQVVLIAHLRFEQPPALADDDDRSDP